MPNRDDDIAALQIKVAALEHLVLSDERLRREYQELIKLETERVLAEETGSSGPIN